MERLAPTTITGSSTGQHAPRTLREHVLEQIGTDLPDQADQLIAMHLLDLLDEDGYLGGALDAVAAVLDCHLPAGRSRFSGGFSNSTPPAFLRAICPNASHSNCATAIGSTRQCEHCSRICRCSPRATFRR